MPTHNSGTPNSDISQKDTLFALTEISLFWEEGDFAKRYWVKKNSFFIIFFIFVFILEWQNTYWFSRILFLNGQKITTRSLIPWKNKRKRKNEKSWKNWCSSLWSASTRISCESRFYVTNENIKIFTIPYRLYDIVFMVKWRRTVPDLTKKVNLEIFFE